MHNTCLIHLLCLSLYQVTLRIICASIKVYQHIYMITQTSITKSVKNFPEHLRFIFSWLESEDNRKSLSHSLLFIAKMKKLFLFSLLDPFEQYESLMSFNYSFHCCVFSVFCFNHFLCETIVHISNTVTITQAMISLSN